MGRWLSLTVVPVVAVTFLLLSTASGLNLGDECLTPNAGICTLYKNCPDLSANASAISELKARSSYLSRYYCGKRNNDPLFCCESPLPRKEVVYDVTNHRNIRLLRQDICGPISVQNRMDYGERASMYEVPHIAALAYSVGNKIGYQCGGAIINECYVLTAAHCTVNLPAGFRLTAVRVGVLDLSSKQDCIVDSKTGKKICAPLSQTIPIEKIIPHPNFTDSTHSPHDIALLRLSKSIDFSSASVKPVCLPIGTQQQTENLIGNQVLMAGWGLNENRSTTYKLMKKTIPVRDCDDTALPVVSDSQMCVGGFGTGGSNVGDSGGPLTYPGIVNGNSRVVLRGVSSYRLKQPDSPGVYSKAGYYCKWILDNMRPCKN